MQTDDAREVEIDDMAKELYLRICGTVEGPNISAQHFEQYVHTSYQLAALFVRVRGERRSRRTDGRAA